MDKRLEGPHSWSGETGIKESLPLLGIKPQIINLLTVCFALFAIRRQPLFIQALITKPSKYSNFRLDETTWYIVSFQY